MKETVKAQPLFTQKRKPVTRGSWFVVVLFCFCHGCICRSIQLSCTFLLNLLIGDACDFSTMFQCFSIETLKRHCQRSGLFRRKNMQPWTKYLHLFLRGCNTMDRSRATAGFKELLHSFMQIDDFFLANLCFFFL